MAIGWPMKTTYANGDVYSAGDVNDITGTINLLGSSVAYAAGKNKVINGDFGIWQRGSSFSNPASGSFQADRWSVVWDGTGATRTVSRQTFTPATAPVSGYEYAYFYRYAQSVAGTGATYNLFQTRLEDVRTFAGQTVTISFWGKAAATTSIVKLNLEQEFGTGGSPSATVSNDIAGTNFSLTTSWQRFTVTTTVPSISGKTVGTTTPGFLGLRVWIPTNATFTLDFFGFQIESGSTSTAFQTATGTIQGELAACQRYYYRQSVLTLYGYMAFGMCLNTTSAKMQIPLPVPMRNVTPSIDTPSASILRVTDGISGTTLNGTPTLDADTTNSTITFNVGVASGLTAFRPIFFGANNSLSAYIGFSTEL
jgi:hypothetical protein